MFCLISMKFIANVVLVILICLVFSLMLVSSSSPFFSVLFLLLTGTSTLSNLGMFSVDRFDAILPPGTVSAFT